MVGTRCFHGDDQGYDTSSLTYALIFGAAVEVVGRMGSPLPTLLRQGTDCLYVNDILRQLRQWDSERIRCFSVWIVGF